MCSESTHVLASSLARSDIEPQWQWKFIPDKVEWSYIRWYTHWRSCAIVCSFRSMGGIPVHVTQQFPHTSGLKPMWPLWMSYHRYFGRRSMCSWSTVDLTSPKYLLHVPNLQCNSRLWNLLCVHRQFRCCSSILYEKARSGDWYRMLRICRGFASDGSAFTSIIGQPWMEEHVYSHVRNGFSDLCIGAGLWSAHSERDCSYWGSNKHETTSDRWKAIVLVQRHLHKHSARYLDSELYSIIPGIIQPSSFIGNRYLLFLIR